MKIIIKPLIFFIILCMALSCGVSTKNKRYTLAVLKCQGSDVVDVRKKYTKRERQLEKRNSRYIKKNTTIAHSGNHK